MSESAALGENKRKRRNRLILSCSNCKVRKVKCDRQQPCEGCRRRGLAASCEWESPQLSQSRPQTPQSQSYVPDSVFDSVRQHFEKRLKRVEAALQLDDYGGSESVAREARELHVSADIASARPESLHQCALESSTSARASVEIDDAEEATLALEVLAAQQGSPHFVGPSNDSPRPALSAVSDSLANFAHQSIVIKEDSFTSPLQGTPLLPWTASMTRHNLVLSLLRIVQSEAMATEMLNQYYEFIGWCTGSIHMPSLRREHTAFWQIAVTPAFSELDPAWIAVYAAVLLTAVQATPTAYFAIDQSELVQIINLGLELANWKSRPQVRACQASMLLDVYHFSIGDWRASMVNQLITLGIAQNLNLHNLGDDPAVFPSEDRAFPTQSLLAREMSVRIWCDIVAYDWQSAEFPEYNYHISPNSFTTGRPRCLTDEDLDTGPWDMQSRSPLENAAANIHATNLQLSHMQRQLRDLGPPPTDNGEGIEKYYASILQMDTEFRSHHAIPLNLPHGQSDWNRHWHIQMHIASAHARLLRLHRPMMVRGYDDPRFAYSTTAALNAARAILKAVVDTSSLSPPSIFLWFMHRNVMTAILAIGIDALHDVEIGIDEQTIKAKTSVFDEIRTIFEAAEAGPIPAVATFATFSHKGRLLISALRDAQEAKRQSKRTGKGASYSKVLKDAANTFQRTVRRPAFTKGVIPTAVPDWIDDEQTRRLLSEIGLLSMPGGGIESTGWLDSGASLGQSPGFWNFSTGRITNASADTAVLDFGGSVF